MTDEEFRARYKKVQDALHRLWTDAVGTPGYDKKLWKDLSVAIDRLAMDSLKALGL